MGLVWAFFSGAIPCALGVESLSFDVRSGCYIQRRVREMESRASLRVGFIIRSNVSTLLCVRFPRL